MMNSPPSPSETTSSQSPSPPPIVYTIAGSDSGGGAGIQADLHAIHGMGCHGCSAITCLTAQNSCSVTAIHAPPASFLREQLEALVTDMPPKAVKVGMLGSVELAIEVGTFLKQLDDGCYVVVDPVMVTNAGHKLIDDATQQAMIEHVFPYADILTPNKYEAEELLVSLSLNDENSSTGTVPKKIETPADVQLAATHILSMMGKGRRSAIIIKGVGCSINDSEEQEQSATPPDINSTNGVAQDYYLSPSTTKTETTTIDSNGAGVWLRSKRYVSANTHGTGCTLSSAIASSLALLDHTNNKNNNENTLLLDACCLGKAYVTQGIGKGVQLGKGPGPVAHTQFPSSWKHFPSIYVQEDPRIVATTPRSAQLPSFSTLLPVVDSIGQVKELLFQQQNKEREIITDIQFRIRTMTMTTTKDIVDNIVTIKQEIKNANDLCVAKGIRLWIRIDDCGSDGDQYFYWEKVAIELKCFGLHITDAVSFFSFPSQHDDGITNKQKNSHVLSLSVSTSGSSYSELAYLIGLCPTYISLDYKNTADDSLRAIVSKWRQLIPESCPLVVSTTDAATNVQRKDLLDAGADSVAAWHCAPIEE